MKRALTVSGAPCSRSTAGARRRARSSRSTRRFRPTRRPAASPATSSSIGSDTMNNLMTLWAETFRKFYPNVKVQVEGKGSSTAPPALIAGTAQFGPMSRPMRATEIDQFEQKYGYKPTEIRTELRRAGRLRPQGQPDQEADAGAGRGHLLQEPPPRLQAERHDLGPARPHRRLGQPADQPLRPQLGERHLRLLQGARAEERRLQGHGEGAARLGLGRAGRHRGPLRHRLQRHRLQDLGVQRRAAGREATAGRSSTAPTTT